MDTPRELTLDVTCNTSMEKLRENVVSCLSRGLPAVQMQPVHDRPAILVGGGPSLSSCVADIKLSQPHGIVFALNGAAGFLNSQGILPDYQVIVDPRPQNTDLLSSAKVYLFASQCAPELFDHAQGLAVGTFHLGGVADDVLSGNTVIGAFTTVGLTAMILAHVMGYRTIHLYGFDSSFDDSHHAYGQDLTEKESQEIEVGAFDREGIFRSFKTNPAMAKQAELFPVACELITNEGTQIHVHGYGLLPTIAHAMRRD